MMPIDFKMIFPLLLTSLLALLGSVQGVEGGKWVRLSGEKSASPSVLDFKGSSIDIWTLFDNEHDDDKPITPEDDVNEEGRQKAKSDDNDDDYVVFFGGVVRKRRPEVVEEEDFDMWGDVVQRKVSWLAAEDASHMQVHSVRIYDLYNSFDFAASSPQPYSVEVAQVDSKTQTLHNHQYRAVTLGFVAAVELSVGAGSSSSSTRKRYRCVLNADPANRVSITYFSSFDPAHVGGYGEAVFVDGEQREQEQEQEQEQPPAGDNDSPASTPRTAPAPTTSAAPEADVKVVSYNVWHTMPPTWVIHDPYARVQRYSARMRHLARAVVAEAPHVVMFQEVRLDSSFRISQRDVGSQVEHLLLFLRQAEEEAGLCSDGDGDGDGVSSNSHRGCTRWNVLYQPAMSMYDKNNARVRHEEGLAIFSRDGYSLVRPAVLLLPRTLGLASDDHNRAVLAAHVVLPPPPPSSDGGNDGDDEHGSAVSNDNSSNDPPLRLTVMTTHFSLDAAARERAVSFLFRHTRHPAGATVLGGDLNGEPGERFMRMLVGEEQHEGGAAEGRSSSGSGDDRDRGSMGLCSDGVAACTSPHTPTHDRGSPPFRDAYLEAMARGPRNVHSTGSGVLWTGKQGSGGGGGLTFPTCNPSKRIDFLLLRSGARTEIALRLDDSDGGGGARQQQQQQQQQQRYGFSLIGTDHDGYEESEDGELARLLLLLDEDGDGDGDSGSKDSGRGSGESMLHQTGTAEVGLEGDVTPNTAPQLLLHRAGGRTADRGMLDKDSPLWASDHFGVSATFTVTAIS